MSDKIARQQLVLSSVITLAVVVVWAFRALHQDEQKGTTISVAVAVAVFGGFFYWRNYKRATAFAANHSLLLTGDAVLIRDGATEHKIPYSAIEYVKIRRPYLGNPNFILKASGAPADTFYGYENIESLMSDLAGRLPSDRIKGLLVRA